jgi:hypothetical protein
MQAGMFVGRNYERADLRNKDLRNVNFTACNFRGADLAGSDCRGAIFVMADLSRASLHKCNFSGANMSLSDLTGAYMKGVNFRGANLWHTNLKGVMAKDAQFQGAEMTRADLARGDFLGARFDNAHVEDVQNIEAAFFTWFCNPASGGTVHYFPFPGAEVKTRSLLGKWSWQENSGRGQSKLEYQPGDPEWFEPVKDTP